MPLIPWGHVADATGGRPGRGPRLPGSPDQCRCRGPARHDQEPRGLLARVRRNPDARLSPGPGRRHEPGARRGHGTAARRRPRTPGAAGTAPVTGPDATAEATTTAATPRSARAGKPPRSKPAPPDYGPIQLPDRLGLALWQFEQARRRGLIPEPDVAGGRWSAAVMQQLTGQVPAILAAVGPEAPRGANRAAERLSARIGLEVLGRDVDDLVEQGALTAVGEFKGFPLYDVRDVDALDADLVARIVADRRATIAASIGGRAAAERLGWRLEEWDRVKTQRGLQPNRYGRYPLADIDALGADEDLAEQLRRDRLLIADRAAVIRRWVAEIGDRYGIETWAWWHPAGWWEVDWERIETAPTVKQVKALLAEHPVISGYPKGTVALATEAGAAVRWARAMREPGRAVILDFETTDLDGFAVEVGVLDACTGQTLLDTLINPGAPIQPGAYWVHGVSDTDVADAPQWSDVLPQLLAVTEGRTVLAYNAPFDAGVARRHSHRDGLDPGHLADDKRWACLMGRRSDWELCRRWLRLDGGHRALADCRSGYDLLCQMTAPPRQPKGTRR